MHALEPCRTIALRLTFSGVCGVSLSQPAGRDCDHTHPRACADMTTNVQYVHPVRAEMLRVAPRDSAARSDRPACAVPCPCRCACAPMDLAQRVLHISPTFRGPRSSSFNRHSPRLPVADAFACLRARRLPLCVLACLVATWGWLVVGVRSW